MACPITLTGIDLGCKDNVGGISEVYINDRSNVTGVTVLANTITAISKTATFKTYKFKRNTGSLTSTPTISYENDNIFYTNDVVLQFNKLDSAKRIEFGELAKGNLVVIVKDANSNYWYLGYDNEVSLSAGSSTTGKAMGDLNGYTFTLQDMSKLLPYPVAAGIIAGLLA